MIQPRSPTHGQGRKGTRAKSGQPSEFEGAAGLITVLVKLTKLTKDLVANFPGLSADGLLRINGLSEIESILWPLFWYKFGQNRAKTCKNVPRDDGKGGFLRQVLLKRVKSCGSCQWVIDAPLFQGSWEMIAKDLPTQRHRGTEENGKRRGTEDSFISSPFSPLCLCASVASSSRLQNRREQRAGVRVPRIGPDRGHGLCFGLLRAQPALDCGSRAAALRSQLRPVGQGGSCRALHDEDPRPALPCRVQAVDYTLFIAQSCSTYESTTC
jgi:hypothetical protein